MNYSNNKRLQSSHPHLTGKSILKPGKGPELPQHNMRNEKSANTRDSYARNDRFSPFETFLLNLLQKNPDNQKQGTKSVPPQEPYQNSQQKVQAIPQQNMSILSQNFGKLTGQMSMDQLNGLQNNLDLNAKTAVFKDFKESGTKL